MTEEVRPTNGHITTLLERVLDELADLADRQRQIEIEIGRLTSAAAN